MVFPYNVPYPMASGLKQLLFNHFKIQDWLTEVFGPCGTEWEYMDEHFWFKTAEDKTLFLLKWK